MAEAEAMRLTYLKATENRDNPDQSMQEVETASPDTSDESARTMNGPLSDVRLHHRAVIF